jgi:hypothetical protein
MTTVADFVYVCEEDYLRDKRLIGDAWATDDVWFLLWIIDTFVTDREHKRRFLGTLRAVDDFVRDFCEVYYARHGEALRVPPALVDALKRRIIAGYWPGVDEIVKEAKTGQPLRAQHALLRTMREDAWRMRS